MPLLSVSSIPAPPPARNPRTEAPNARAACENSRRMIVSMIGSPLQKGNRARPGWKTCGKARQLRLVVHVDVFDEAALKSAVEHVLCQDVRETLEVNDVYGVHNHIARMTTPEPFVAGNVVLLNKRVDHFRRKFELAGLCEPLENVGELWLPRAP